VFAATPQRATYDAERKETIKVNTQFHFDKTIYMDRFLVKNKVGAGYPLH